ncbi:polycystin family receptor for egg jelly [Ctenodactylus gundi]
MVCGILAQSGWGIAAPGPPPTERAARRAEGGESRCTWDLLVPDTRTVPECLAYSRPFCSAPLHPPPSRRAAASASAVGQVGGSLPPRPPSSAAGGMQPELILLLLGLGLGLGRLPPPLGPPRASALLRSVPRGGPGLQLSNSVRPCGSLEEAVSQSSHAPSPPLRPTGSRPSAYPAARSRCPTQGASGGTSTALTSSDHKSTTTVPGHSSPCCIWRVKIHRPQDQAPVLLSREAEATLEASVQVDCPGAQATQQRWEVFSVPSANHTPDWTRPLDISSFQTGTQFSTLSIPRSFFPSSVYVFNFTVSISTGNPKIPLLRTSDSLHVRFLGSRLRAVRLVANSTVGFTEELILNGTASCDPDARSPLEGLRSSWYCTTNAGNYIGDQVTVTNKDLCHPEHAHPNWLWAPGPILTLLPETLKAGCVYYFRMVARKGSKTASADQRVRILHRPAPQAHISCIENCGSLLTVSHRFSVFLNCTWCGLWGAYSWSILSPLGDEVSFDWTRHTVTGRNRAYLSVKAFAFQSFVEAEVWVSVCLASWSGMTLTFRRSFTINHGPQIGTCHVTPAQGITMLTKFVVSCSHFQDKHVPLVYKIIASDLDGLGKMTLGNKNSLGTILYRGTQATAPPSFLPVGALANHYTLQISARVYDSLGASSEVTLSATVHPPTDRNSSTTVLHELLSSTRGPTSWLAALLRKQDWLHAGYFLSIAASVLNNMKTEQATIEDKAWLREHLVNQSFLLPLRTLEEAGQVVSALTDLTQKPCELTQVARERATERLWQVSQALQTYQQQDKGIPSEQIEILSAGILRSLSNILELAAPQHVFQVPFYIMESLSNTIAANKVPDTEATVLRTPGVNMYVEKLERWDVAQIFRNQRRGQNWFHMTLTANRPPGLPAEAPISLVFWEFAEDTFPGLDDSETILTEVGGFRMTGATENGSVVEVTPEVVEVYLARNNLTSATFNLTVGPDIETGESSKMTTGRFSFEVDSRGLREVLVHIVTEVTEVFTVWVYTGKQATPDHLVATFLVSPDLPPVVNQTGRSDPACAVKKARVLCLPPSLLQVTSQHSSSPKCGVSVVLRAPRFVLEPSDQLVRISIFSVRCLDMFGIQHRWREDTCTLGAKTTWDMVHCVCRTILRRRWQRRSAGTQPGLRTHYVTAEVTTIPRPVDLQLNVTQTLHPKPVILLTVALMMVTYTVLASWALCRDRMDQVLRDCVIVLPDNDPYDSVCYLVTIFTGSRCGAGTRATVFVQLRGTESASETHCLSHPLFPTFQRGSIHSFLVTAKSDLGDILSIRVWHKNEGRVPSWYLSRIKVENLFSRRIWLFVCRRWLSMDATLDRTFRVTPPDEAVRGQDFFLIDVTYKLGTKHMWFSVFAGGVAKPFSRLQRLSCCLVVLLSTLLCNILFLSVDGQGQAREGRCVRSMVVGTKSAFITVPVQLLVTFFFNCSQEQPPGKLEEAALQKHAWILEEGSGLWEESLCRWCTYEMDRQCGTDATNLVSQGKPSPLPVSLGATINPVHQHEKAGSKAPKTHGTSTSFNNRSTEGNRDVPCGQPSSQQDPQNLRKKPHTVLPWWCVYATWVFVFATCGVSSFLTVFYGLTYGHDSSLEWLLASFCSLCQSVFVVQPSMVILESGVRTLKSTCCKDLSWSTRYHDIEIELCEMRMCPDEMQKLHEHLTYLRGSRIYQPLTEDEIRILRRRKRIRRRAILFLSYILTHFIFLVLLLLVTVLLRHTDSFYYNQFLRDQFSVGLTAVTKLEGIYVWLHNVLVPLIHDDRNPTFLSDSSSKILGLPLMRQIRAKPTNKPCPLAQNSARNSVTEEIHCHPQYGIDMEDMKNYSRFWEEVGEWDPGRNSNGFVYKPQDKKWAYWSYGLLNTYGSGGYAFYFFPEEWQFNSTWRLHELQGSHWLDEQTWAVILELTTFNPDVGLFCSVSVLFEVSPLGMVNASLSTHSFSLAELNSQASAEIYVYVAILLFFVAYVVDEGYVITQERAAYVKSVYNLLNFALKCMFTGLVILFVRKHFVAMRMIQDYLSSPGDFVPFHAVSQVDGILRTVLAVLLFLTILKTLRYSRFFYTVRLAQCAIQAALPALCHVALMASVCLFMFMVCGYLVFSQHEWNYSNLIRTAQTVLFYCISAFQSTEFPHNRALAVPFLSSFVLVIICVFISLLQAVILSAYEDMKQPVYEEPSGEVEAMTYLYCKLRAGFSSLRPGSWARDEPEFFTDMLYGQPEKHSHQHLGLKTRTIHGKKMVYLVV